MTVQDDKIIDGTLYVDVIPLCDPCASDDALPIRQLQVRKVLEIAPVSRSLAAVIAVLAFSSGRRS